MHIIIWVEDSDKKVSDARAAGTARTRAARCAGRASPRSRVDPLDLSVQLVMDRLDLLLRTDS